MSREDLMIGDWVQHSDTHRDPFKMEDVSGTILFRRWTKDNAYAAIYSYEEIEPITLTPKILMKNGFREDRPDITYRFRRNGETTTDIVDVFFHNNGETTVSINGTTNDIYVNSIHCHCKYVHELQHALRLCGISIDFKLTNKEIE